MIIHMILINSIIFDYIRQLVHVQLGIVWNAAMNLLVQVTPANQFLNLSLQAKIIKSFVNYLIIIVKISCKKYIAF